MRIEPAAFDSTDCATAGCPNEADTGSTLCRYCRRQEEERNVTNAICKADGCLNVAPTMGRYAGYCSSHRARKVREGGRNGPAPAEPALVVVPEPEAVEAQPIRLEAVGLGAWKGNVAAEAIATVEERMADYGPPADNHAATASFWRAYLLRRYGVNVPLDAEDVCWLNGLQKISRQANKRKRDNTVDVIGFAINASMSRAGAGEA